MIIYSINNLPKALTIGKQTETGVTQIGFDCAEWLSNWSNLALSAMVTPPGGEAAYPANTEMDGSVLVWTVNRADTVTSGRGTVEILGIADGLRKLSATIDITILRTTTSTTTEPPEAVKTWFDTVMEGVTGAEGSATRAEAAADSVTISTEEINAAGNAVMSEIEQKRQQTLADIPDDYTTLYGDVGRLKDTKADAIIDTSERSTYHELHAQYAPMGVTVYGDSDGLDDVIVQIQDVDGNVIKEVSAQIEEPMYGNGTIDDSVAFNTNSGCDKSVTFTNANNWNTFVTGSWSTHAVMYLAGLDTLRGGVMSSNLLPSGVYGTKTYSTEYVCAHGTADGYMYISISFERLGIEKTTVTADVKAAINAYLAEHPLTVYYQSNAYDPANEKRVYKETRNWIKETFDGEEAIQHAGSVGSYGFYWFYDTFPTGVSGAENIVSDNLDCKDTFGVDITSRETMQSSVCNATSLAPRFAVRHEDLGTTKDSTVAECVAAAKAWLVANPVHLSRVVGTSKVYMDSPVLMYPPKDAEAVRVVTSGLSTVEYKHDTKHYIGANGVASRQMLDVIHMPRMLFFGDTTGMTKDDSVILAFEYRGAENYINASATTGHREDGVIHKGYAKVKWQGTSSLSFPKKNYTVTFYSDAECTTKLKIALREKWGAQSKYCMKANFIDPSHCRNVIAAKLWAKCVMSRPTDSLSYQAMHELPNAGAIDGYPILAFINGAYIGMYTMNIPKDEWMFGMTDGEGKNVVLCGENYSSATSFSAPSVIDGTDWDYEVSPADKSWVVNSFNRIYSALSMAENTESDIEAKKAAIEACVDIYSVIDYYIFINKVYVTDNTGKNQLMATYDGERWIMGAYDMDTAFGMHWSGAAYLHTDKESYGHALMAAVLRLYANEYSQRLATLSNILSAANVCYEVDNFLIDVPQAVFEAEAKLWPDMCGANMNAINQIKTFMILCEM